jgi:hypothetical protein
VFWVALAVFIIELLTSSLMFVVIVPLMLTSMLATLVQGIAPDPGSWTLWLADLLGMRVRITVGRPAVGRPASMPQPESTGQRVRSRLDMALEMCQHTGLLGDVQPTRAIQHGNTRGVISAVFEPAQTFQDQGQSLP